MPLIIAADPLMGPRLFGATVMLEQKALDFYVTSVTMRGSQAPEQPRFLCLLNPKKPCPCSNPNLEKESLIGFAR